MFITGNRIHCTWKEGLYVEVQKAWGVPWVCGRTPGQMAGRVSATSRQTSKSANTRSRSARCRPDRAHISMYNHGNCHHGTMVRDVHLSMFLLWICYMTGLHRGTFVSWSFLPRSRSPVTGCFPSRGPVTRKISPFNDVIMKRWQDLRWGRVSSLYLVCFRCV